MFAFVESDLKFDRAQYSLEIDRDRAAGVVTSNIYTQIGLLA